MSLLKWLGLCDHKWKAIHKIAVYDVDWGRSENPDHYKYVMQCEHCGWIRIVKT